MSATLFQVVALFAWHTPSAIAAALEDDIVHSTMHASLLGAALLFWWDISQAGRFGYGWGILMLLISAKLSGLLGAVLAFGGVPLYQAYRDRTAAWGLSLLEDQQLAGTLMLSVGGVTYVLTAVGLAAAFLAAMERRYPTSRPGPSDEQIHQLQADTDGEGSVIPGGSVTLVTGPAVLVTTHRFPRYPAALLTPAKAALVPDPGQRTAAVQVADTGTVSGSRALDGVPSSSTSCD